MSNYEQLNTDQQRQLTDMRQVYDAWRAANATFKHSFSGSMRWLTRRGRDYLHRKHGRKERSLGPRSPETEKQYAAFIDGRDEARADLKRLAGRLDQLAPVNVAMGIGRMPRLTARILRRLDEQQLLGRHILVVGTNALFAYEARAGVVIEGGLLATGDADLLWDARQRVSLLLQETRKEGIVGLLRKVDRSFKPRGHGDFRAYNADGYWVDLIRPMDHSFFATDARTTVTGDGDDLHASAIEGLRWLVNGPRLTVTAIASDGYPVPMVVPDPRVFAVHKLWVAEKPERDPVKRPRDIAQAHLAAQLARTNLGLRFDDEDLAALPMELRNSARVRLGGDSSADDVEDEQDGSITPNW